MGKNYPEPMAVALYGLDLAMCGSAFYLLRTELVQHESQDGNLRDSHQRVQRKNACLGWILFPFCSTCLCFRLRFVLHLCADPGDLFPA